MARIWKWVVGWENLYEVDSAGCIRSVDRTLPVVNRFGRTESRTHRGKQLSPSLLKNGYLHVSFTRPGGVRAYAYVHSVVAEAFVGPRPCGLEVCHNDGNKTNNDVSNLRYGTRSANALDRHKHGTMNLPKGEDQFFHKLTEENVLWIRANAGRVSQRKMGEMFGVSHGVIGHVQRGTAWKHVNPSCSVST